MKQALVAFAVGLIFALGLGLSGMTQPQKVFGFLDVGGSWDPSLMFVMIGAIGVHALSYRLIRRRSSPLLSSTWHLPAAKDISVPLAWGSLIFGIGWGLGGFCPGPAVTALAGSSPRPWIFVGSMLLGMLLYRGWMRLAQRSTRVEQS